MTKTELLADLAGRSFVKSVGTPELMETKPDGTKWYKVNVAETLQATATYRNIDFYVFDEREAEEAAFYKDRDPDPATSPTTFRDWLRVKFIADTDIVSWNIRKADETFEVAIIEALIADPDNTGQLLPVMYFCGSNGGTFFKQRITVDPDIVAANSKV
jgi:hypothetical protein